VKSLLVALAFLAAAPGTAAASSDPAAALSLMTPKPVKRAADFRVSAPDNRPLALADFKGKVVFLNFWATWCKPCEEEMPAMQRLHDALAHEGLALIAVSTDEGSAEVEEFAARLGLRFPILWDPSKAAAEAYQAYRFPETLLIDRDGVVVERYIGPREWDSPLYVERIRRLLAGAESLP
jgi:peroxiredoxin